MSERHHGKQFHTVSGSMHRLPLSLINLVRTLEITTKQLKNITLHILKQKQIGKKTKTQVFLLLHFAQSTAVMSHHFVTRSHTMQRNTVPIFLSSLTADFQVKFKLHSESNIKGTLSTWWPMFTSGKRFIFKPFILSVSPHVTRTLLSTHFSRILH